MNANNQAGTDPLVKVVLFLIGAGLYLAIVLKAASDPRSLTSLLMVNFAVATIASFWRRWALLAVHGAALAGFAAYTGSTAQSWPLYLIAASFLGIWITRYLVGRDTAERAKNGPVQPAGIGSKVTIPRYAFKDVEGMAATKEALLKAGKEIRKSDQARNGMLLTGDPGNGKTFFAEALAGELNLPFLSISFGDIASMWVGESTQKAMQIFDEAERNAPCVLFIDEIDSVFIDRSKVVQAEHEAPKTLNAILTRLVSIRGKGVVLIAATNFPDKLDAASIRDGRFDYKFEVPPPDYPARLALLKRALLPLTVRTQPGFLSKLFGNGQDSPATTVEWDAVDRAAKRWEGFSVARINAVAAELKSRASDGKLDHVTLDALLEALRAVQGGKGDRLPENIPNLDELVLSPEMKSKLGNIAERMINIEVVEKIGGSVPAGILFYGPPGTGKTLGVMALAKTTGWAFLRISGQDLLSAPNEIDNMLKKAADIRPCIVFIDEADDVLADRRMSIMTKSVINKLLAAMDGAGGRPRDVVFVAATNNADMIDQAALRGGRFTEKIGFELPDENVILEYVSKWIASTKAPLAQDFTAEAVSAHLKGQSLANSREILQCAVNQIVGRLAKEPNSIVTLNDLIAAKRIIEG